MEDHIWPPRRRDLPLRGRFGPPLPAQRPISSLPLRVVGDKTGRLFRAYAHRQIVAWSAGDEEQICFPVPVGIQPMGLQRADHCLGPRSIVGRRLTQIPLQQHSVRLADNVPAGDRNLLRLIFTDCHHPPGRGPTPNDQQLGAGHDSPDVSPSRCAGARVAV
jgi:hypothetical protein